MDADAGFEASLKTLEQTVKALEAGDVGLDAALAHYETGIRLLSRCHKLLDEADRKVALLTGVSESGEAVTEVFDASATFDANAKASPSQRPAPKNGDSLDELPF